MPGTPTTPDNLPIILDTDSPDIPRDMNNLSNAVQAALRGRGGTFATAVERDSYYAQVGLPHEGALVWLEDKEYYTYFHDSQWIYAYSRVVRRDTDLNMQAGGSYDVVWETAEPQAAETTGMAWTSAGIVVPKTGIYSVQFVVAHLPGANGVAWTQVLKNDADLFVISMNQACTGGTQNQSGVTQLQILQKGTVVTGRFSCSSATTFLACALGLNTIPVT